MTKLVVDGKEIDVPPDYTLLQACKAAGAEIPLFCFHDRLSIAGNCRMCLVELRARPSRSPPARGEYAIAGRAPTVSHPRSSPRPPWCARRVKE